MQTNMEVEQVKGSMGQEEEDDAAGNDDSSEQSLKTEEGDNSPVSPLSESVAGNNKEGVAMPNGSSDEDDDDNTDIEEDGQDKARGEQQLEVRNGEFQFQIQSFHIVNARQGKKQYKCDVCTGTYQHAFSLKRHFLRTHINYRYLSEADITNCNINLNLVRQLREETEGRMAECKEGGDARSLGLYRCHLCSTLFDTRDELKTHVSTHAEDNVQKGLSCGHCEMTFSHRQNLVRHQSVHSTEKQYLCRHCGKSFPSLANQKRHEKIHENLNLPYPCKLCAATFMHGVHLQKHLKKLHFERLHLCNLCPRFFLEKQQLEQHSRIHRVDEDELPPKKCKVSDSRAVFKGKRGKNFDSELKYSCSICKRRFATYLNMCRHKKAAHASVQQERRTRSLQLRKEPVNMRSRTKPVVKEMSEEEFYTTIAHRISENLLYHLDGKSSQLKIRQDECAFPEEKSPKANVQWSMHNFPAAFDITQMMQIYSNRVPSSGSNPISNDGSENSDETECLFVGDIQQRDTQEQRANGVVQPKPKDTVIGRHVPVTFICLVCTEKFSSLQSIEDHKINNHPNVLCTHMELEGEREVPPELCWKFMSPVGFLHYNAVASSPKPEVPPSTPEERLECTKCHSHFASRLDLHQHILDCGSNSDFQRQLTKGHSVHSRLGCSARKPASPVKPSYVKGRRRLHVGTSPTNEPKRPCKESSPLESEEGALDLKMRVSSPVQHSVSEVVLLEDNETPEKEEDDLDASVVVCKSTTTAEDREDSIVISGQEDILKAVSKEKDSIGGESREETIVIKAKVVGKEAAVSHSPGYVHHSSPGESVKDDTDDFPKEAAVTSKKKNIEGVEVLKTVAAGSKKTVAKREKAEEEDKAEADLFDYTEGESAPSPAAGHGRRILRSKTAAASGMSNASSSSLVNSHTCSTCKRSFTYLASLKKHLRDICPNKKVAGQRVTKRRKGGRGQKKDSSSVDRRAPCISSQESTDYAVKKETLEVLGCRSESPIMLCEETDTRGLELLANASSMDSALPSRTPLTGSEMTWASELDDRATRCLGEGIDAKGSALVPKVKEEDEERASEVADIDVKPGQRPFAQEHSCPYCLHSFAYLSNFRKHLREVCLLKKKKLNAKKGASEEATTLTPKPPQADDGRPPLERADASNPSSMSFKGRIENSVINLLRNQSKQVELIGTQTGTVKDQPGGANHSSPNFMTFSCPVCHKIFLSYVKMLQHRLSHKLQTDEAPLKEERLDEMGPPQETDQLLPLEEKLSVPNTDIPENLEEDSSVSAIAVGAKVGENRTDEDHRFDEIMVGLRGDDIKEETEKDGSQDETKRDEHNYAVSLAELDSLPEEEEDGEVEELKKETPEPDNAAGESDPEAKDAKPSSSKKGAAAAKKGHQVPTPKRLSPKVGLRRKVRKPPGRPKGVSKDKQ
ncbi:hypothetical protein ISCGN_008286 [Ixodes scapularis]